MNSLMGMESGGSKGSFGTHDGAVKTIAMTALNIQSDLRYKFVNLQVVQSKSGHNNHLNRWTEVPYRRTKEPG